MKSALGIRELFQEYGDLVDQSLRELFVSLPTYDMYGHMAYFMGFTDEKLEPLILYGGKRFRSSLMLMLADWYGVKENAISIAVSLELYHNFTLIHDDIVDGDTLRRGRKTVWNLWGIPHAINSGDGQLLLAGSVLHDSNLEPSQLVALERFLFDQYRKVVEGQYLDFTLTDASLTDESVNEKAYFEMIGRKTAELVGGAAKVAGIASGQPEQEQQKLYEYGYHLGIAYQLCDDTVSIWGTEEQTGKRGYGDILEKKKTLPILHAMEHLEDEKRSLLISYYEKDHTMTEEEAKEIVALLDSVHTYEYIKALIDLHATHAKDAAAKLSFEDDKKATLARVVDVLLPDVKNM